MAIKKDAAKREAGKVSAITTTDLNGVTTWMLVSAAQILKHKYGEKRISDSMLDELKVICRELPALVRNS